MTCIIHSLFLVCIHYTTIKATMLSFQSATAHLSGNSFYYNNEARENKYDHERY